MPGGTPLTRIVVLGLTILAALAAPRLGEPQTCVQPPAGMTAWWPGDGDANDLVGGHNGSPTTGVTFPQGKVAGAFGFDGASSVEVADDPAWDLNGDFTIDLWVNIHQLGDRAEPFIAHNEGGGNRIKWVFWSDSLGHSAPFNVRALRFNINPSYFAPEDFITYPWSPMLDTWYHVAVTRAGNTFALYLDGQQVATNTVLASVPNASAPLSIGRSETFFLNGQLDEVEILNGTALTASEIAAIFNAGAAGKCKPVRQAPIVFVHGWCGDASETWEQTIDGLQDRSSERYGARGDWAKLYYDYRTSGGGPGVYAERLSPSTKVFSLALTDYQTPPEAPSGYNIFDKTRVSDTPIPEKAFQLREAITFVKEWTGAPRVIVVGHSQGGLIARAYVQGMLRPSECTNGEEYCFGPMPEDVGTIVTIDTPHKGSAKLLATIPKTDAEVFAAYYRKYSALIPVDTLACIAASTASKAEMTVWPSGYSSFLKKLNERDPQTGAPRLPAGIEMLSLATYDGGKFSLPSAIGDCVVSYDSQNLKDRALPFANIANVLLEDNPLDLGLVAKIPPILCALQHSAQGESETIDRVDRYLRQTVPFVEPPRMTVEDGVSVFPASAEFKVRLSRAQTGVTKVSYTATYLPGRSLNAGSTPPSAGGRSGTIEFPPLITEHALRLNGGTGNPMVVYFEHPIDALLCDSEARFPPGSAGACVSTCAGQLDGTPCTSFFADPCTATCIGGACSDGGGS